MGLGGISPWQLLIILLIVVVIFGTKKLSSLGSDLGGAVKGFRKAMNSDEEEPKEPKELTHNDGADSASMHERPAEKDKTT